jgi:hypothetical protein
MVQRRFTEVSRRLAGHRRPGPAPRTRIPSHSTIRTCTTNPVDGCPHATIRNRITGTNDAATRKNTGPGRTRPL